MPALEPLQVLRVAQEAMIRVERGSSERDALLSVVSSNPLLAVHRRRAFRLLMETVDAQDIVDRVLRLAFPETNDAHRGDVALSRLAVSLKLRGALGENVNGLRQLSSTRFRKKLECLIGFLWTLEVDRVYDGLTEIERVALRTHHPSWWTGYCFKLLGRPEALRLLTSPLRPRYIRINTLRNRGRLGIPRALKNRISGLTAIEGIPGMFKVENWPSELTKFLRQGLFQIQDLASYLAVLAAEPRPRENVLDLCSAPGAKTAALAQLMKNRGTIVSVDSSIHRMRTWSKETARLGVTNVIPILTDASNLSINDMFDLVLVDPPCSGTGVLDRNPRMKWRLSQRNLTRYSELQSRILNEAASYTSPGGRILYCTCSLTTEENEDLVSGFLRKHPEFETKPILETRGSSGLKGMIDCRRFYPHRDRTAGYFIARIERPR